jgi:hypothetical protein
MTTRPIAAASMFGQIAASVEIRSRKRESLDAFAMKATRVDRDR